MPQISPLNVINKNILQVKRDLQEVKECVLEMKQMLHAIKLRLDAHEEKNTTPEILPQVSLPTDKIGGGWFF